MKPFCSRNWWSFPRQRSEVPVYHRSRARVFALAGANHRQNIWLDVGDRTVPYAPCDPNSQVHNSAFELRRDRCLLPHKGTKTKFKHVSSVVASPSAGAPPYCAAARAPFGRLAQHSPIQFLPLEEVLHSVIVWRVSPLRTVRTIALIDCSYRF